MGTQSHLKILLLTAKTVHIFAHIGLSNISFKPPPEKKSN